MEKKLVLFVYTVEGERRMSANKNDHGNDTDTLEERIFQFMDNKFTQQMDENGFNEDQTRI